MVTGICYLRYTIIHDSPMNDVDTVSCVKYLMIWLRTIQFEMHRPVFFNRFDSKTLWLNSGANNVAKTILCHGSFVIIKSTNWRPPRVVFSWLIWLWRSLKITWPVINSSALIVGKLICKKDAVISTNEMNWSTGSMIFKLCYNQIYLLKTTKILHSFFPVSYPLNLDISQNGIRSTWVYKKSNLLILMPLVLATGTVYLIITVLINNIHSFSP